jgi:hypothetical protein
MDETLRQEAAREGVRDANNGNAFESADGRKKPESSDVESPSS